jgi:hypothetical protein
MSFAVAASGDRNITYQVTTAQSGVYTVPGASNIVYDCYYTLIGGGGGGGGGSGDPALGGGGGGGGAGAYTANGSFLITGLNTIDYIIGSGGIGGSPDNNGGDGEDSVITPQGQIAITALKGEGGNGGSVYNGGNGGNGAYGGGGGGGIQNDQSTAGLGGIGSIPLYNGTDGNLSNGGSGGLGGSGAIGFSNNNGGGGGGGGRGGGNGGGEFSEPENGGTFGTGGGGSAGSSGFNGGNGGGGFMRLVLRTPPASIIYNAIGGQTVTFTVPQYIRVIEVEMIGAGGYNGSFGAIGGNGGYIKGRITNVAPLFGQSLTISAGLVRGQPNSSTATYLQKTGNQMFLIAGSGGSGGFSSSGNSLTVSGGGGGGGIFSTEGYGFISPGITGSSAIAPGFTGQGGGGASITFLTTGGIAGQYTSSATSPPALNGTRGTNAVYPALPTSTKSGGVGTSNIYSGVSYYITGAGGDGYVGGGSAGADYNDYTNAPFVGCGGGGSSFYDNNYVSIQSSYSGSSLPTGVLPNFGRSGQIGYISVILHF